MWNEILGALVILAMVVACGVFIPATPTLVAAISDRIRYGAQKPAEPDSAAAPSTTSSSAAAKPASAVTT